jgi:hypothetical protein
MRRSKAGLGSVLLVVAGAGLAGGCVTLGPDGRLMRDPTGNAVCSLIIPGVGQFMNQDWGKGALMMALNVLNNSRAATVETDAEIRSWVTIGAAISIWSAVDAHQMAVQLNVTRPLGAPHYGSSPARPPVAVVLDPANERATATLEWRF